MAMLIIYVQAYLPSSLQSKIDPEEHVSFYAGSHSMLPNHLYLRLEFFL